MKKQITDSINDLRCGTTLICPESYPDRGFTVTADTTFGVNDEGFWGVDCPVCQEMHLLNYVYQVVDR